jgi:NADH dehydrogenase [ubiquinone] 1 alpha subcomplex assembly factor 1
MDASLIIATAISTGVPLFNAGDAAGCAAVYGNAIVDLLGNTPSDVRAMLSETLDRSSACSGDHDRAWLLRHALDGALAKLRTIRTSAAPAGKLDLSALSWVVVDDRVMGGRSQSRMVSQADGTMVFSGEFVVAGGGFASVRANLPTQGFRMSGSRGFVLNCEGDGRLGYKMILKTNTAFDGIMYQASFDAPPTPASFTIPFSSFRPTFRGQPVPNAPPLRGDDVSVIGFMLSRADAAGRLTDEPAGAFSLRITGMSTG